MNNFDMSRISRIAVVLVGLGALAACGNSNDPSFPLPEEPVARTIYDLIDGPVDRPSSLNVLAGRSGEPLVLRVSEIGEWDFCFGMLNGEPVWLPRGYFEGLVPSSGVVESDFSFDDVVVAPDDLESYEYEQPVPITVGKTYVFRSRPDPGLSITCAIYAKAEALTVEGDPAVLEIRILWNPNCNETNLNN